LFVNVLGYSRLNFKTNFMKSIKTNIVIGYYNYKLLFFILIIPIATYTQTDSGFGVKAGVNYNANGDYFESITSNAETPDRNIGYHIGVFGKLGEDIYVKPELMYTATKSDYLSDTYNMKKIDLPILVGAKVIGPMSVFAGPAFQYILDSDFEGISVNDIDKDFSVGLNFGIGFNLKKVGIDLRYERGFSENEGSFLNNNNIDTSTLDTRPDQLILSLSFIL